MKNCPLKRFLLISFFVICLFLFFSLESSFVSASLGLQFVSVNNERVDIAEDGKVYTNLGDAVRISGYTDEDSEISIFLNERELDVIVLDDGRWYVLFSITNMEQGDYVITGKAEDMVDESFNLVITVKEKSENILQASDNGEHEEDFGSLMDIDSNYFWIILVLTIVLVIGALFVLYYYQKRDRVKKGSKKGNKK